MLVLHLNESLTFDVAPLHSADQNKTLSARPLARLSGGKRPIRAQPAPLGRRFCGSHLIHTKRRTGAQCQHQNPPFFLRFGSKWPLPPNGQNCRYRKSRGKTCRCVPARPVLTGPLSLNVPPQVLGQPPFSTHSNQGWVRKELS